MTRFIFLFCFLVTIFSKIILTRIPFLSEKERKRLINLYVVAVVLWLLGLVFAIIVKEPVVIVISLISLVISVIHLKSTIHKISF